MAKQRIVNTKFWDDSYVARMRPNEKLLFLYLLTNPLTTIAGVYELPLRRAAFDTGLPVKEIQALFERLESDGKIVRDGDWVAIVNFIRHQSLNPKVRRGIEIELEKVPERLVEQLDVDLDALRAPHANARSGSCPGALSEWQPSEPASEEIGKRRRALVRTLRFPEQ